MSTFDTLMDWYDGDISDMTAISECLRNLAFYCPEAVKTEAYRAIETIVTEQQFAYHIGDAKPNYPMPAIPLYVDLSMSRHGMIFIDTQKGNPQSQVAAYISDEYREFGGN